jgi:Ca2+:H+ antiporter
VSVNELWLCRTFAALRAGLHDVVKASLAGSIISVALALVLLVTYALNLLFVLVTHRTYFSGSAAAEHAGAQTWGMGRALGVLAVATVGIAWMSEMLVGAVEPAAHALGMNSVFVGIFVVAILGNAAEHATAITAAVGNRMDLTLGIAVGSSAQITLFVTPVLVLASLGCGPQPMDLVCFPGLVLTVFFAVLVLGQVSGDGESNWIKGVQLLAVYLILALVFYFAPGRTL